MRYRPDIDGLRAIAVLPVVFFHLGFPGFGGGFVGVDMFFVISGFLITAHIAADLKAARFSLAGFYERRIRRIFPALFAMIAATSVAATLILFPRDLISYANSLIAAALFGSNVEFWRESGYFDAAAQSKPLLHTWSLGVEEQFYLLFPVLLVAMARLAKTRQTIVLLGVAVLSLLFCWWAASRAPAAAFYLFPARLWELVLGALLTIAAPRLNRAWLRTAASAIGMALLVLSVLLVSPRTPLPQALLGPCLGAALIMLGGTGEGSPVNGLLSARPLVFVGRISYSLYLWHWPIIVLAAYQIDRPLTVAESIAILVAATLLAALSWRFIEQPFRVRRGQRHPAGVLRMAVLVSTTAVAIGIGLLAWHGLPQRYDPAVRQTLAAASDIWPEREKCLAGSAAQFPGHPYCRLGTAQGARPDFILWGDSHAAALAPALSDVARGFHQSGVLAAESACAPLMGVERYDGDRPRDCSAFNDRVLRYAIANRVPTVFLSSRWALWAEGTPTASEDGLDHVTIKERATDDESVNNEAVFARALARTVGQLRAAGIRVVIVGPVPEIDRDVPEGLARRDIEGRPADFAPTLKAFENRQRFVLATFAALQAKQDIEAIYPHLRLCQGATCAVRWQGKPLYADNHHLSLTGARGIETLFAPFFAAGPNPPIMAAH